jgi:predicted peptidase
MKQTPAVLIPIIAAVALAGCTTIRQTEHAGGWNSPSKSLQTSHHFARTVTQKQALDYLLFLPRDYNAKRAEGWPMILFLHGAGERGTNLSRVKAHGPPKRVESHPDFPFVLVSPQCPEGRTWDVSELTGLLDEVIARHNIDTNRIYLTGLSMGGFGTWSLGMSQPERFAAIAPICGGGERLKVLLAGRTKGEVLRKLPVWAFHGAKDPVVPLEESERMIDALKRAGAQNVKLTVYPEAGHDSWTRTYDQPEFYQWLLEQKREP